MNDNGFVLRKLVPKTFIHPRNVQKRMEFALDHQDKDQEYWDNVIWSDETTVRQKPVGKEEFVHVHKSVKKEDLPVNGFTRSSMQ